MAERPKSPTRTKATWKPRVDDGDPCFLRDRDATLLIVDAGRPGSYREPGRSPVAELPYQHPATALAAADLAPQPLIDLGEAPKGLAFAYRIVGGYDANAVQVTWDLAPHLAQRAEHPVRLAWVVLKTFTGLQIKYPLPGKKAPLVFALADEDAYVYCDEPVCQECTFRCKQGMVLYGAFEGVGVVRLPLSPNRR